MTCPVHEPCPYGCIEVSLNARARPDAWLVQYDYLEDSMRVKGWSLHRTKADAKAAIKKGRHQKADCIPLFKESRAINR